MLRQHQLNPVCCGCRDPESPAGRVDTNAVRRGDQREADDQQVQRPARRAQAGQQFCSRRYVVMPGHDSFVTVTQRSPQFGVVLGLHGGRQLLRVGQD